MRTKLKFTAIFLTLLFAMIPLSANTANAMTFSMTTPAFGLYSDNKDAVIQGKVKYVLDENAKAVQYSEYDVKDGTFFIPFISSAYNVPDIDIDLKNEICYGCPIGVSDKFIYDFYSSDLNGMSGTIYSICPTSESFTVNFEMLDNQNFIYQLTQGSKLKMESNRFTCTVSDAQTDITYEVFILNGDCIGFESSAQITKETVTVKEYIDRQFIVFKEFFSPYDDIVVTPDIYYALVNQAVANNINYEYFNFFIDSFARMRLNAYKIEIDTPCTINYSMPVVVQKNGSFAPAIYKTDQTVEGNYAVDYTIELNNELPFIIESSAEMKKQSDNIYTAQNVTEDFYFVFSSSQNPIIKNNNNNKPDIIEIVLCVVISFAVCALIVLSIVIIEHYKKAKK